MGLLAARKEEERVKERKGEGERKKKKDPALNQTVLQLQLGKKDAH